MKKILSMMLVFLGATAFEEKEGRKILTSAQRQKIVDEFGEDYVVKFTKVLDEETASAEEAGLLVTLKAQLSESQRKVSALEADKNVLLSEKDSLAQKVASQQTQIDLLSDLPETDSRPAGTSTQADPVTNDKFLFGVNMPFMAIDERHPYNKRAFASLMADREGIDIPTPKQSVLDYESLKADLGDFYRIRKQDRIQSFLLKLPSLESLFPLESGYQDRATLVNVFLDEFSQADNTSSEFNNVVKGGYKFEPEELRMHDVMFAYKFKDLKKLEKTWIGYLNKEGSNTMKWSFIEFIMVETGKKLHNEREQRRVAGIRKDPVLNNPGKAMEASDGLFEFIKKKIASYQIRTFALGEWTESTISDYIRRATALVPTVVRDTGNLVLYMSTDAITAYHKNNEQLYGLNQDYNPDIMFVKEYPNVAIKAIPNAGNRKRMIWTLQGNIALFEDQKGEMYNFFFEQEDWSLKVWSNWKESIWAYMVGKKYNSADEIPTDYSTQLIFCNDVDIPSSVFIEMNADDATPSVANHTSLVSVANTQATAITNIDDAVVGVPVKLKCGSAAHAVTIAKSGNFSTLTAAWEPEVGDVLTVIKRSDGKFIEISRETSTSGIQGFDPDDATPDVTGGDTFITDPNTAACAISNLDNAIYDRIYTLHGAGSTNASTIANAGNFSLTAAMTLSAGKWIKLVKSRTDQKFYEISRG